VKQTIDQPKDTTMDSMTIIAVASIVTAGFTTGIGCMGRRWAKAGRSRRR
jgi:hypothetical protein